jgi:hypothetical protein
MEVLIWSLKNKLEDVRKALCKTDLTSARLAMHEFNVRLLHAQAGWREVAMTAKSALCEEMSALLNETIHAEVHQLLVQLKHAEADAAEPLIRSLDDHLQKADDIWTKMANE